MIDFTNFKPLRNTVFVTDLEHGAKLTNAGIIIPDDNMKESGIRPRWGRILCVGPDVEDLVPGDWIYVEHGKWTNGIEVLISGKPVKVWRVDYPENTYGTYPANEKPF